MRMNHVHEVCQEGAHTAHAQLCTRTAVHTQHPQPHTSCPGRGREQGSPRPPLVPSRDKLRPGESSTETGWGLGEFPTQLLRTMRSGTHAPGRAQEGVSGPQPGLAAL